MGSLILVPENTLHKGNNIPLVGTWGSLTFDIAIASYTLTPFSFSFSLFYTTGISEGEVTVGAPSPFPSTGYRQILQARTDTTISWLHFLPLSLFFFVHRDRACPLGLWEGMRRTLESSSPMSRRRS